MVDLPLGLRHSLEAGECVLFVGAGIGHYYSNADDEPIPSGKGLACDLANYFSISVTGEYDLTKISKIVEIRHGRLELIAFLKSKLLLILTKISHKTNGVIAPILGFFAQTLEKSGRNIQII